MEISGDVTDAGRTNDEQGKIELLSKWMLDAEFRNCYFSVKVTVVVKDTSGDPVADAEVQLPFDGLETIVATTDIDGQARFTLR